MTAQCADRSIGPLLDIDGDVFASLGAARAHAQLQAFAQSTRIDIELDGPRLTLRGTDLAHHGADPHLHNETHAPPFAVSQNEYAEFHTRTADYDLCMEDSWSGYFLARCLESQETTEPIVLIHLDDHTDMMSTLLAAMPDGLWDPGTGGCFNPALSTHWRSAIRSGAVGIGSFVTALYYLQQPLHVLHLNHVHNSHYASYPVFPRTITHPLLPRACFAAICKRPRAGIGQLGTYKGGRDASSLLETLPAGRVIVHIDLDYFINDYNGNVGAVPARTVAQAREHALALLNEFIDALRNTGVLAERWIIATSPGFCSARHWRWLINELATYIRDHHPSVR